MLGIMIGQITLAISTVSFARLDDIMMPINNHILLLLLCISIQLYQ